MLVRRPAAISFRVAAGLAIALIGGVLIGYMDSRPGWDDTGITAVSLVLVAGIGAFVAGRAPILVAVLTGMWVPVLEASSLSTGGPLLALVFAGVGAGIGWLVRRQ